LYFRLRYLERLDSGHICRVTCDFGPVKSLVWTKHCNFRWRRWDSRVNRGMVKISTLQTTTSSSWANRC